MPLLDTDVLSLFRNGDSTIAARLAAIPLEERYICSVSVVEVLRGHVSVLQVEHDKSLKGQQNNLSLRHRSLLSVLEFFQRVPVLPYDDRAEVIFQSFPNEVKRGRANDCRIAAVAMIHDLAVATRNIRDFSKIPSVTIEDWQ